MELREITDSIYRLQKQNRRMRRVMAIMAVLWLGLVATLFFRDTRPVQAASDGNSILRARGLVITDENGIERVWIGAPLPNPPLFGKRYKRSVSVSGILMFDADGNERSGYVTNDRSAGDVFLSLDSVGDEIGDFTANAGGGVSLEMRDGPSRVSLGATHGGPRLKMLHQGKTLFQQPPADQAQEKTGDGGRHE